MAIGLVGQKLGMTRILADDGSATAVSVIKVESNRVVQTKTVEVDGYSAVQVTTGAKVNKKGEAKLRRVSLATKGHYAKASQDIGLGLWEFRADADEITGATSFDLSIFGAGQFVDVTGQSKGKGFQGGVKRHNFQMQDATHGNSISHRAIGSTGQCQEPGRVFKGKKMAGHMGDEQVTQECLEVIRVDSERNLILVKGAIPGANKGFVKVNLSAKKDKVNKNISKQLEEQKNAQALQKEEAKAEKAAVKEAEKAAIAAEVQADTKE
jgi:large subunit ribosomal protein L3